MQPTSHQSSPEPSPHARARGRRVVSPPRERQHEASAIAPVRWRMRRGLRFDRRLTKWEWLGFGLSVAACIFLWPGVWAAHHNLSQVRVQVDEKEAQLAALERQKNEEKGRLAHLKSEKGREQLLVERGYLKPGDRFLLFPEETHKP